VRKRYIASRSFEYALLHARAKSSLHFRESSSSSSSTTLEPPVASLPLVFVVDRDKTVAAALKAAFPHCSIIYCIWHVLKNIKKVALEAGMQREEWTNKMRPVFQEFFATVKIETFAEEWAAMVATYVDAEHRQWKGLFKYVEDCVLPDKEGFCKAWLDTGFLFFLSVVLVIKCFFFNFFFVFIFFFSFFFVLLRRQLSIAISCPRREWKVPITH
jgi:hypothetical protein